MNRSKEFLTVAICDFDIIARLDDALAPFLSPWDDVHIDFSAACGGVLSVQLAGLPRSARVTAAGVVLRELNRVARARGFFFTSDRSARAVGEVMIITLHVERRQC